MTTIESDGLKLQKTLSELNSKILKNTRTKFYQKSNFWFSI